MALTHDGIATPLSPNPVWLGIGGACLVGGLALAITQTTLLGGIAACVLGLATAATQIGGTRRVRITWSKLLIEDERPVRTALIGPSKVRVPWPELAEVSVAEDHILVKRTDGGTVTIGQGCPKTELENLARRIIEAGDRFKSEEEP